jgi:hypothetical protein
VFTTDLHEWTKEHQRVHSLYWSAFLGLAKVQDTDRLDKRYDPSATGETAKTLLKLWDVDRPPRIRKSFMKLALWTLAPRVLDAPENYEPSRANNRQRRDIDPATISEPFRSAFREQFDFEPGADGAWDPDRLLVPELPELGIEGTRVETRAYRRSVVVHTETVVTRPFGKLAIIVNPSSWVSCPFWAKLPAGNRRNLPNRSAANGIPVAVRLPGGRRFQGEGTKRPKQRDVLLKFEVATSAFEARIDYEGKELGDDQDPEAPPRRPALWPPVEIDGFRGFLQVEKLAGRPGACLVTAEREARYLGFNHDRFRAETTAYWVASDLLACVEDAGGDA